jgi:hypothetical protein
VLSKNQIPSEIAATSQAVGWNIFPSAPLKSQWIDDKGMCN